MRYIILIYKTRNFNLVYAIILGADTSKTKIYPKSHLSTGKG